MGSQSLGPTHRDSSEDHYRLPWGQDDIFGRANVNDSDSVEKENTEAYLCKQGEACKFTLTIHICNGQPYTLREA